MRLVTLIAVGVLITLPPVLSAQGKWPLRGIRIDGNTLHTDAQLMAVTGLKVGQPADKAAFEAGQAALLATGVLESVAFRFGPSVGGQGYVVTYEVAEIQQAYPLHFDHIGVPDEDLIEHLKRQDPLFTGKVPGTERLMDRYARLIEQYLRTKGIEADILGEVTASTPDEFYISFHPKGAVPVVAEVDFKGNSVIPTPALLEAINGVAIGTRFTEGTFRLLLNAAVKPAYEARGRVDVTFPEIEAEPVDGDVKGVAVTVTVDEGESYTLGDVRIEGTSSMTGPLYDAAGIKPGDIANLAEVSYATERIDASIRSAGYLIAKTTAAHEVDRKRKEVDVVFTVEPGPLFRFGELILEGLDLNGEYEIKRLWGLRSGDPFDPTYAEFFLERITEEGLFDNLKKTKHEFVIHEETGTADIKLIFNPPEQRMRFGTELEPDPNAPGQVRRRP